MSGRGTTSGVWRRWIGLVALLALVTVAILRITGVAAAGPAMLVAVTALAVRVLVVIRDAMRGLVPWTRALLPSIIAVELLALSGAALGQARLATAIILELTFVGVALRAVLRPTEGGAPTEQRIADALTALVPHSVARIAAIELTLIAMCARFLAGGWRRPVPAGFSYHRESGLRMMLPVLPLLGVGDVLLLELVVLRHAPAWLRFGAHALALYGLVWLVGLYASLRERPHTIDRQLVLRRGILRALAIESADIASIAPLPAFADDWKKRDHLRGTLRLDIGAAHVLELRLRDGRRVIVGVDDPARFVEAVTRFAAPRA